VTYLLTQTEKSYLSSYMNKVSRSFTLVAPQVESPLGDYLAVAYLVCRVVDNIEDSTMLFQNKHMRFAEFTHLLDSPQDAEKILKRWSNEDWDGLSSDEIEMMTLDDGGMLWQIYAKIPEEYRSSIQKWATTMAAGMALVTNLEDDTIFITKRQIRLPRTAVDYDRYCFYVAGTVGRMITELAVTYYKIDQDVGQQLLNYSETCGRALQKTNIVKDFAQDLARGDSFLPDEWLKEVQYTPLELKNAPFWWKKKVLLNVLSELDDSVNYIINLPKTAVGYRKAGLLMMLPAYQTLLLATKRYKILFTPKHAVKISRTTMGKCLIQAQVMVTNDAAIQAYGEDLSKQIKKSLDVGQQYPAVEYAEVSS
jgi:farnesyl-diphosphate farnesyltransferase